MKATEARKIKPQVTDENREFVNQWLEKIYERVRKAATEGKNYINSPFYVEGMTTMFKDAEKGLVREQLIKDGYVFKWHPNPDPGHPASFDYESLHW